MKKRLLLFFFFLALVPLIWAGTGPVSVLLFPPRTAEIDCSVSGRNGYSWFNSTTNKYEGCSGGVAIDLGAGGLGGAGIDSINSQTGASQTIAAGTTGTDIEVSSATNTHTINVPSASATARGVVTTGAQTIAGAKTFTGALTASGGVVGDVTGNVSGSSGSSTGNSATATALAADGTNASAGSAILGVDASGNAQGAFDVATQVELDAHLNDTTAAHAASAIGVTPFSTIAATDVQAALAEIVSEQSSGLSQDLLDALQGTDGTPTDANRFVTNSDARLGSASLPSVKAAATGNLTLANPGTAVFDGVTLSTGEGLLLAFQTADTENGAYVFDSSSTPLVRRADLNQAAEFAVGFTIPVDPGGTLYGNTLWRFVFVEPVTLGTTPLQFVQTSVSFSAFFTDQGQVKNTSLLSLQTQTPLAAANSISSSTTIVRVSGSGGPVTITANPRIEAGTKPGQLVWVCGDHATNTVTLPNGNGIYLQGNAGSIVFGKDKGCVPFFWLTDTWYQAIALSLEDVGRVGKNLTADETSPLCIGDIVSGDMQCLFTEAGVSKHIGYTGGVPNAFSTVTLGSGGNWIVNNAGDSPILSVANDTGLVTVVNDLDVDGDLNVDGSLTITGMRDRAVWDSDFMIPDGTHCIYSDNQTVNNGPTDNFIGCIENAGQKISLKKYVLPTNFTGGTLGFVLHAVSDTTGQVLAFNIEAQCRTPGTDTLNATWSSSVAISLTATTAFIPYKSSEVTITPNGSCLPGDWLFARLIANTGTNTANLSTGVMAVEAFYAVSKVGQ